MSHTTRLAAGIAVCTTALLLTSCTSDDDSGTPPTLGASALSQTAQAGPSSAGRPSTDEFDLAQHRPGVSWEQAVATARSGFDGRLSQLELDRDDGRLVYSVELVSATEEHDAKIDAESGEVIKRKTEPLDAADRAGAQAEAFDLDGLVDPERAMAAALAQAPGRVTEWTLERESHGGTPTIEYEIDVVGADGTTTEVRVDATTGAASIAR
ncbi:peptidase M4 family protein [Gordonia hirsuta DSM 44140 = NBRC 16056]|uniref:Peptidase M4 family protein n=1 Tax=Gordonia hirsuta DSM 44140 = NBRC 16056 TaxID=1121927 RepID=L7LCW5_9ACTN|nr:PepSY domain-containing protein [Gordonia hirsuta]GAC58759.1 peptidase M4 family protein [Gordonia hirsuta DSM 44140 = NBRC 16056]